MAATLREIAKLSGVSIATVSQALNSKPVNEKTRLQVLKAAKQLRYRPNILARGLRLQKTYTLGFTVGALNMELLNNIVWAARDRGYQIVCQSFPQFDVEEERKVHANLLVHRVDGVLIWPSENGLDYSAIIQDYHQHNIPVVVVDKCIPGLKAPSYLFDNRRGAKMAWSHLWSLRHQPVIYLDFEDDFSSIQMRREGVRDALLNAGIRWKDEYHVAVLSKEGLNNKLIRHILESIKKTGGAIFAAADHIALGVIREAHKVGIAIPKEVALVGFEDVIVWLNERVGWTTSPPLSTIRMDFGQVGRNATDFLIDFIEQRGGSSDDFPREKVHLIEPKLVVRESCGGKPGVYGLDENDEPYWIDNEEC